MLPTTIRAAVSSDAIHKASRLFNGSITDILNETLQNSRRAGATKITIDIDETTKPALLTIRDDGKGISNPANFVTLGESNWDSQVYGEDPAGMGAFALSATTTTITSRAVGASNGWRATITPDAWSGETEIAVETANLDPGTTIQIEMSPEWLIRLDHAVNTAAKFFPLPVIFKGKQCNQSNWFAQTIHRKKLDGYEIGVIETRHHAGPTINFHGLTIDCRSLPSISEVSGTTYRIIVDMTHAAGIELVLPARKEVIQNAAFEALKDQAKTAIFEAIAKKGNHTLSFNDWNDAAHRGVDLQHATPALHQWTPNRAETQNSETGTYKSVSSEAIIVETLTPSIAHPFDLSLSDHTLRPLFFEEEQKYQGYPWYDDLARVENIQFHISVEGRALKFQEGDTDEEFTGSTKADAIELHFDIVQGDNTLNFKAQAPVAFFSETYEIYDPAETSLAWTNSPKLDPHTLTDMLVASYFSSSDDPNADSYETQCQYFENEAYQFALNLLESKEAAIRFQLTEALSRALWILPEDATFTIKIHNRKIDISNDDVAAAA